MRSNRTRWASLACALALLAAAGCGQHEDPLGAATLELKHGKYSQAIKRLTSAPDNIRNTYGAQLVLAKAYRGAAELEKSLERFKRAAELGPDRAEPHIGMAEVERRRATGTKNEAETAQFQMRAAEHCQRALELDEKNAKAHTLMAELLEERGEFKQALESRKKAVEHDPENLERKLDLAELLLRLREPAQAMRLINEALEKDSSLAGARVLRARHLLQKDTENAQEEAKKELRLALAEESISPHLRSQALDMLAMVCLNTGELEEAMARAEELEKDEGSRGRAVYLIGLTYVKEQNWEKAYEALKGLERAPYPQVVFELARVEEQRGMENQAIGHYQQIVENLNPRYVPAHLQLARLMLHRQLYQEAMQHCEAVLRERPAHPFALRVKASIYRARGSTFYDPEKARVCYLKMLMTDEDSHDANLDIADLYLEAGRPEPAMSHAMRARSQADTARVHETLGRAFLMMSRARGVTADAAKDHMAKALQHMQKAHELMPEAPSPVTWIASIHTANKDYPAAISILQTYIGRAPQAGRAYLNLAAIYEETRQLPKAIATLERAAKVPGIRNFSPGVLGRAYFLAGMHKEAIATWQKLVIGRGSPAATRAASTGLAVALASDGQYQKAIGHAQAVVDQAGGAAGGALLAGCIAIQGGQFPKARQFFERGEYPSEKEKDVYFKFVDLCKGAGDEGKRAATLISEASLLIEFGSSDAALARLKHAAQLVPKSVVPHYLITSMMVRTRRFRDLLDAYNELFQKFPEQGYPHYQLAMLNVPLMGQVDVRQQLELALDLDPGLAVARIALAQVLLNEAQSDPKLSTLKAALEHADEAVRLQDGGTKASLEVAAKAHYAMTKYRREELLKEEDPTEIEAKRKVAVQNADAARKALQTLQDKFPASVEAVKLRIRFEIVERGYARAAALASSFIQNQRSDDSELRLLLAIALTEQAELDAARKELAYLIDANPTDLAAYRQLTEVYRRMQRPDLVMRTREKLLSIQPNNPTIAFDLARAYLKYGRPVDAKKVYESILRLVPPDGPRGARAENVYRPALLGVASALTKMPAKDPAEREANLAQAASRLKVLTDPPDGGAPDPWALLTLGLVMEKRGQPEKALEAYRRCIELNPDHAPPHHAVTLLYYRLGQYGKAIDNYTEKLVPQQKYNPGVYARLALLYLARNAPGDSRQAVAATNKAMDYLARRARPSIPLPEKMDTYYHSVRTLAFIADRKYFDARNEIQKIANLETMTRESYVQLVNECARNTAKRQALISLQSAGLLQYSIQDFQAAIDAFQKAEAKFPGNLYLLQQLADLYQETNELNNLAAVLEKRLEAADKPDTLMKTADLQDLYIDLVDLYLERVARESDDATEKAMSLCKRGSAKWPKNAKLLRRLAAIHAIDGLAPKALEILDQIIAISPEGSEDWVQAKKDQALTYAQMRNLQRAVELCDDIEKHIESDPTWLNNSAWFHAVAPKSDLRKAIQLARQAKTLRPRSPQVRDTLGWIYHLAGAFGPAQQELEYAAQQLPNDANVAYHLGANQVKLKQLQEGLDSLRRALDLNRRGAPLTEPEHCKKLLEETEKALKDRS